VSNEDGIAMSQEVIDDVVLGRNYEYLGFVLAVSNMHLIAKVVFTNQNYLISTVDIKKHHA
jgi:hypothetical protein